MTLKKKKIDEMTNEEILKFLKDPNLKWFDPNSPEDEKEFRKLTASPGRPKK